MTDKLSLLRLAYEEDLRRAGEFHDSEYARQKAIELLKEHKIKELETIRNEFDYNKYYERNPFLANTEFGRWCPACQVYHLHGENHTNSKPWSDERFEMIKRFAEE